MVRERIVVSGTRARRLDSRVFYGPALSPQEYARALAAKATPVLNQVYEREEVDEDTKRRTNEILAGASRSVTVSTGTVIALRDERLASPSALTANEFDKDGLCDFRYKQGEEGVEHLRVTAYAVHLPEGEGIEQGRASYVNLRAIMDDNGHNFNQWTLSRSGSLTSK